MSRTKIGDIWEQLKRDARRAMTQGGYVPAPLIAIMELHSRIETIWSTILYLQKRVNELELYYAAISPPPRSDPEPPEPSPAGP